MLERKLSTQVLEALKSAPVVFVNGPRQAGKSTLVQLLARKSWPAEYVTFDEASQMGAAMANPEIFLRAYDGHLILDEVQMVPELFRVLKVLVDEARLENQKTANGRYLLTGSANIMALPMLADALVGRMNILTLLPLSAVEITKGKGVFLQQLFGNDFKAGKVAAKENLANVIEQATFPEITQQDVAARSRWFEGYISTMMQRDVRQIAEISKMGVLPNLLRVLASRAGGLLNETDLGRSIGQNNVTTRNYRILLQMMFLTFDVKPWFRNIGKRLVKSAKGYIIDTSLMCHLQQVDLHRVIEKDPHLFGPIFENFVASELLKLLSFGNVNAQLFHFRTSDNKEVDFILEKGDGRLAAIEVKSKDRITEDDFKGLIELQKQVQDDLVSGVVLYRGNNVVPFGHRLWAVPVALLWK